MSKGRHHIDYSEDDEIQLPVPKRVPIIWSDEDDRALAETSSLEIRIWRKVKELYGIDATDIIPPNRTASFLSARGTENVPVWALLPARRLTKILKCPIFRGHSGLNLLHYSMLLARFHRLPHSSSNPKNSRVREYLENDVLPLPAPPRDLPIHSDFTKNIERCAEKNVKESSVALGISSLDFDIIINSWDMYVRENPEHGLKTVAGYSARRNEPIPVSENEEILQMKKRALVNAFRRPEGRIADDAQMPEDLESPNVTSDDEPPMQHQEDVGNLEYSSEPMAENAPPRQSTQSRRDLRRGPVAQNHYQSESEDSDYQPNSKALNGLYNRSRKHQGNGGRESSEHRPDSVARYQSSEYSAQHQSESEGSGHQPSPATLSNDNLSVRQGRARPKDGPWNRMMKPTPSQGGPSSVRRSSKQNPPVLAEVIAISSDDEYPIQKSSNGVGPRREKALPETTRTRSSGHSAHIKPKKEFEAELITDNRSGLYAGSRRRTEDYGLEGEEVATYSTTRTRFTDSPFRYQRGTSYRSKLSSYSTQRRTGWEYSDEEDEDDQSEVMMKDSAQRRRKGNPEYRRDTLSSLSQTRGQIDSGYQLESPSSLSDRRQKESAESQFHSLNSFQHRTVRERNSDYEFKTSSSLLNSRKKESGEFQIQPLTSSAQYIKGERSTDYQLGLTTRTKASEFSNNRREERYSELRDWNSLYDEDLGDDGESEIFIPEENFRVQSFGFKDPALVGGNDEVSVSHILGMQILFSRY